MNPPYKITGLLLAGGTSTRMGQPKALLPLAGETIAGRVIGILERLCREVIIVTRNPLDFLSYDLKTVRDLVVGQGPLGGLATGLFYARNPWSLTVACDLPFLRDGLLEHLIQRAQCSRRGPRAIVPRTPDGWQPLVAVYSKECLGPARELLQTGQRKVEALRNTDVNWVDVDESELRPMDPELESFVNLNTPEDLERARILLESK